MCNDVLKTASLQFGFEQKVGTVDAISVLFKTEILVKIMYAVQQYFIVIKV